MRLLLSHLHYPPPPLAPRDLEEEIIKQLDAHETTMIVGLNETENDDDNSSTVLGGNWYSL